MYEAIVVGLSGLLEGTRFLASKGLPNLVMMLVAAGLLYLAIKKDVEPLLLLPIGFGCFLVNMPLSDVMESGGVLKFLYDIGIITEIFPLLIFVGIGAMTDFGPLPRESEDPALWRSRAIRHLSDTVPGSCARIFSVGLGLHRDYRRLRRSHRDLHDFSVRSAFARSGFCGGIFIYGPGAYNPAAHHACAYEPVRAPDPYARQQIQRLAEYPYPLPDIGDGVHGSHRAEGPPADGHDHAREFHEGEWGGCQAQWRV